MNKESLNDVDLYFITDSKLTKKGVLDDVRAAVDGGVKIVQYREKGKSVEEMIKEARQIKEICGEKALFIVNDSIEVALAADADGVHLGQDDMKYETAREKLGYDKIIGITVHNVKEADKAQKDGADYVGVSPIFETKTKLDAGKPSGIGLIKEVKEKLRIPFVAIGGIHDNNLEEVLDAGADKVAMISELAGNDVKNKVEKYVKLIKEYKK